MRKVIFRIQVSLDGFVAGPNGELDWPVEYAVSEEGWNQSNTHFA